MRDASTYRGARRNRCFRKNRDVWGPEYYFDGHNMQAHKVRPWQERLKRKTATTSNAVHEMLRRGDYAGAVRQFFSRKGKSQQRGQ